MNKKLVALAVAGAFALPLAAEAQTANVTLYGRLNMDLEFVRGTQADGSNPTVNRVSSNSSRFGMRGTESLGGGLNAIFQIESNVSGDTGNAASSSLAIPGASMVNSSPPSRATVSPSRMHTANRSATRRSSSSPTECPRESLIALKRSRSR